MQTILSTTHSDSRSAFRSWREALNDRMGPIGLTRIHDGPFEGSMECADVGNLRITRIRESGIRSEITPALLRRRERSDSLFVLIQLEGRSINSQDGREAVQRAGEIVVLADRPNVHISGARDRSLVLELPVDALEGALGPTRRFTAVPFGAGDGTGSLVTAFFDNLVRVHEAITPTAAERMSRIGTDLIVASLAETLSRDVPRAQYGALLVQRAKAYVDTHLDDPALDPTRLAGAIGVSLRRLQELFQARGAPVSEWIWQRRLAAASKCLADPDCTHMQIGTLAHRAGFASQAHFSRRFKDRYGMTPRDYRQAALVRAPRTGSG